MVNTGCEAAHRAGRGSGRARPAMASLGHIVRRLCPTCLELPRLQGSTCQPVPGLVGLRQLVQTPMTCQTW